MGHEDRFFTGKKERIAMASICDRRERCTVGSNAKQRSGQLTVEQMWARSHECTGRSKVPSPNDTWR